MTTYFLYARKSTDVEDKQVRSIEDQLSVLRLLAKQEGLTISKEFIEKQSAKVPGRPVFNTMLARIAKGEAQGIVCWKLDRLARNPVDGGQISWFLQQGIIQHIQSNDRSYRPTDNFMLMAVEFGMANQFILDLSANTKRGSHEKVKRGEYPSLAPIGYLNDRLNKTIVVDKATAQIVKAAFECYAEGGARLEDISMLFTKQKIFSENGRPLKRDRVTYILSNPFYCGFFRYAGELHEGNHTPIITKKLFDTVQLVLQDRGRPHSKPENEPRALCKLLRCTECGCMITAEEKTKHQKNGNIHKYVYYHCTKRKGYCSQPCIREEDLTGQLSGMLKEFVMSPTLAAEMFKQADKDKKEAIQSSATTTQEMRQEIQSIVQKLQRLLDAYLNQDIEREIYLKEKTNLLSRKKSLEEKTGEMSRGAISWLEPLQNWIKDAQTLGETHPIATELQKKAFAKKIFGSNLFLGEKKIEGTPILPWEKLREAQKIFRGKRECVIVERVTGIEPVA